MTPPTATHLAGTNPPSPNFDGGRSSSSFIQRVQKHNDSAKVVKQTANRTKEMKWSSHGRRYSGEEETGDGEEERVRRGGEEKQAAGGRESTRGAAGEADAGGRQARKGVRR
ncbi:hypothetical protein QQ045_021696 [Rhodiola kirilowii]